MCFFKRCEWKRGAGKVLFISTVQIPQQDYAKAILSFTQEQIPSLFVSIQGQIDLSLKLDIYVVLENPDQCCPSTEDQIKKTDYKQQ